MSTTLIVLSGIVRFVSAAYFNNALMSSSLTITACCGASPLPAAGNAAIAIVRIRRPFFSITTSLLFHLDQLNRHAIGPLDHGGPHTSRRVDLFEELDALSFQPAHGTVEVGNTQGPVIDDVPPRADQSSAGPRPDQNGDVVEVHAAGRLPDETRKLEERGPGRRSGGRLGRRTAPALWKRGTEVLDVPAHGTQRMLVIHVHVVEPLHLTGLCVLDQRAVWTAEIPEASLPGRRSALRPQFQDLLLRRKSGQRVARHVDELSIGSVPHLGDLEAHRAKSLVVLARVWSVPAEVPDRRLWSGQLGLWRRVDFREEQIEVAGFDGFVTIEHRLTRRRW